MGEDQKKGLHVFRRPIYPPKSSEDQKNKGHRVLTYLVSTVPLTRDISLYFSGGKHAPWPPRTALVLYVALKQLDLLLPLSRSNLE